MAMGKTALAYILGGVIAVGAISSFINQNSVAGGVNNSNPQSIFQPRAFVCI